MDVPDESGRGVAVRLVKRLLGGISQSANVDVTLECLDCLTDVLKRFGYEVGDDHEVIVNTLLAQLMAAKKATQKKTINCLSTAAVVLRYLVCIRLSCTVHTHHIAKMLSIYYFTLWIISKFSLSFYHPLLICISFSISFSLFLKK
jgi:hypothetical protein